MARRRSPAKSRVMLGSEPELRDLLLVLVAAHERALSAVLLNLVTEFRRYAVVLDATSDAVTRQRLSVRTRIDSTNLSKVTGPLVAMGWLRAHEVDGAIEYQRSPVVDYLLRGKKVAEWQKGAMARLPRASG